MQKTQIALAAGLLLCAPLIASAADATPPKRYSLKQTEPSGGTHIVRELASSNLPLDKPYGELTPQQQRVVKAQYEELGPDDEPPYPLNGPRGIVRALADGRNRLHVNGKLLLAVDVNSSGEATAVSVMSSPDDRLTQYAAAVLMKEKYKPARCNGAPCAMQYPVRILMKAD